MPSYFSNTIPYHSWPRLSPPPSPQIRQKVYINITIVLFWVFGRHIKIILHRFFIIGSKNHLIFMFYLFYHFYKISVSCYACTCITICHITYCHFRILESLMAYFYENLRIACFLKGKIKHQNIYVSFFVFTCCWLKNLWSFF